MKLMNYFLDDVATDLGFIITPELRTYIHAKRERGFSSEQIAVAILNDEGMDILLNMDLKKQIQRLYDKHFG